MDDLISRQAAIEAVHKNYDKILDFKSDGKTIASSVEDIICDLPSVTPEIIQCGDVVNREAVVEFFDDWMSALDTNCHHQSVADLMIIKGDIKNLPSAQPEQRWIPCSERLPEKEVVYIITVHYDDRNFITFDNFCSYKHGWKEWSNQEVLA